MFDHVKFGVSDYAASKAFFLKALAPLGVTVATEWPPNGIELSQPKGTVSLCLYQTDEKPAQLHLAFTAESRQQVEAFYRAALGAGGKDNGAPGLRPQYQAHYFAAFVIGPDGHNIEAVCHEGEPADLPPSDTPLGRYRHYKGGEYEVIGGARHSETHEPMVVYRPLYNATGWWVRPHAMFFESVTVDGAVRPRFEKLD